MPMIDLKFTKKQRADEKKEFECCGPGSTDEEYPYNTQMRFDGRVVEQSDVLRNVKTGDEVMVLVEAKVNEVRKVDRVPGKKDEHTVELQFQKIEFNKPRKGAKGSGEALKQILDDNSEQND